MGEPSRPMKRTMKIRPGYDCRVECKHEPPGDHGICGDEWTYGVSDGERAVVLSVLSTDYPASVDREALPGILGRPLPATLVFHVADPEGGPCDVLEGGRCRADVTYLGAGTFWRAHGDDRQSEQPEAFWLSLESELQGS